LPAQELYDFEIPGLNNYVAAGLINHNSDCAAAETACHLTGEYPPWWRGRKWTRATHGWAGGDTTENVRDIIQKALLGEEGEHGTGWIPRDKIRDVKYRQAGVTSVAEIIRVTHVNGQISTLGIKTYEQKRKSWQGTAKDFIWADEEPEQEIYSEMITRLIDKKGMLLMTFTPLNGPTSVVRHFMDKAGVPGSGIYMKNVTWDDAPHLDEAEKTRLRNSYEEWERDTRTSGQPLLGTGAVFPIRDELIAIDPLPFIPRHWPRINGIDFGIGHPGAGAFCALDPEGQGTFYVLDTYKAANQTAVYHAEAMKKYGTWIPNAWPHDGLERDKGSGIALKNIYRGHGLYMLREHAHLVSEQGKDISVNAPLNDMLEWMKTGRFKVVRTCRDWFEEKRGYYRKDGVLVRKLDDVISASRYAFMMRRLAAIPPTGLQSGPRIVQPMAGPRRWRANT
jgi:phage terminase large subunit-like protein